MKKAGPKKNELDQALEKIAEKGTRSRGKKLKRGGMGRVGRVER